MASQNEGGPSFPPGHVDLTEYITLNQLDGLNQKSGHDSRNLFKKDSSYLESDVDEQLLITVPFNQNVKLHSIKFVPASISHAPKTIKLFVNRTSLSFDDVESTEATQVLELNEEDYSETRITPLRFVKWQSVFSITVFIENNLQGEETTQLQQIIFIGQTVETTKMDDLKKIGAESGAPVLSK